MATKRVLEKGLLWKVELGGTIEIWKDPWVPLKPSFKVKNPRVAVDNLMWVSINE